MKQQYGQILVTPKPFVKWAGGKRQLISTLNENLPESFGTYFEPFLGGGALLFNMLTENNKQKCIISDLNSDLVLAYATIRDNVDNLISSLKQHEKYYQKDSKSYYYSVRESTPKKEIEKTSRLLFLNRTCFNGLYRVNSKGQFNVPFGRTPQGNPPQLYLKENIEACSQALENVELCCEDFYETVKKTKSGDFVYLDPPYHAPNKASMYSKVAYTDDLQDRVAQFYHDLAKTGAKIMLNNSATLEILKDSHESIKELYENKEYRLKVLDSNWSIGAIGDWRGKRAELMVTNFKHKA